MKKRNILQHYWSSVTSDYFNFTGRARRLEYWGFSLISLLIILGLEALDNQFTFSLKQMLVDTYEYHWYDPFMSLSGIYGLLILIPTTAVGIRRFHDIGKFGWLIIALNLHTVINWFPIFPLENLFSSEFAWIGIAAVLVSVIWLLVMLFTAGDKGPNKYGPDPKNPVLGDELDQIGQE
ncbi:MAG: hypothetical protein COA58_04520 [Bacteroidetes bacterium]|nr:MAG: hypothetical protein COA58_04520 [Bacteroidota bacterium]